MQTEQEIRRRVAQLRQAYDRQDPPSSPMEDEAEIALLRAIEELEWVLEETDDPIELTH